jgi:hypothetical protein
VVYLLSNFKNKESPRVTARLSGKVLGGVATSNCIPTNHTQEFQVFPFNMALDLIQFFAGLFAYLAFPIGVPWCLIMV